MSLIDVIVIAGGIFVGTIALLRPWLLAGHARRRSECREKRIGEVIDAEAAPKGESNEPD